MKLKMGKKYSDKTSYFQYPSSLCYKKFFGRLQIKNPRLRKCSLSSGDTSRYLHLSILSYGIQKLFSTFFDFPKCLSLASSVISVMPDLIKSLLLSTGELAMRFYSDLNKSELFQGFYPRKLFIFSLFRSLPKIFFFISHSKTIISTFNLIILCRNFKVWYLWFVWCQTIVKNS